MKNKNSLDNLNLDSSEIDVFIKGNNNTNNNIQLNNQEIFKVSNENFNNKLKEENVIKILNESNINNEDELPLRNTNNKNIKYIELIYAEKGYTKVQYTAFIATFLVMSLEGLYLYLSTALISSFKFYYSLSDNNVSAFTSIMFIGIGIGSFSLSIISNYFTRQLILITSLIFLNVFLLIWSMLRSFYLVLIVRCVIGIFLGILVPLSNTILCEVLPIKKRAFTLTLAWLGFALGEMLVLCNVALVMPQFEVDKVEKYLISIVPYNLIIFLIIYFFLQDSPRNLLNNKKYKQAYLILEVILNRKLTNFEKKTLKNESIHTVVNNNTTELLNNSLTTTANLQRRKKDNSFVALYNSKYLKTSIIINIIGVFSSALLYGPMLISNLEITMSTFDHKESGSILKMLFIVSLSSISNPIGGVICEVSFIGRRLSCVIACIISIISSVLIIVNYENKVFYNGVLSFGSFLLVSVLTSYVLELFPTRYRDIAVSLFYTSMRIGGFSSQFFFPAMYYSNAILPYYFYCLFYIIIIVSFYLLPYDTYGRGLDD